MRASSLLFCLGVGLPLFAPPKYGRRNANRYAQTLYRFILKGSPLELSEVADELASSARSLIHHASNLDRYERQHNRERCIEPELVTGYADDILLLIADKRFCRVIVESSPGTALALFREIGETEKYNVKIGIFAKNIVREAISNKNSFLFHEAEGYESGLIGYHKPLSQAMFANYKVVESIDTMLDAGLTVNRDWDAEQWGAYCRIVLMAFRDYVESGRAMHSSTLNRAKGYIEHAVDDLYKIDGVAGSYDDDVRRRLRVVVGFIQDAVKILDEKGKPKYLNLRVRERNNHETFYDHLANMIFEVIFSASDVRAPRMHCWMIQHNAVWCDLMNFHHLEGPAGKVIKFKLRRLIYNEILEMNRFPNFKGAKILGFCLNVMGFELRNDKYDRDTRALQKVILEWTKRHFAWLYSYNRQVAEACLVDGHEYDAENHRLVRIYPADGLRREPSYKYLDVDIVADSGDESPKPPRFLGI